MHCVQVGIVPQQELNEPGYVSSYTRSILHCVFVPGHGRERTPVDKNNVVVACLQECISDLLGTAVLASWSLLWKSVQVEYGRMVPIEVRLLQSRGILDV